MTLVITIEKDVPMPGSSPRTSPWEQYTGQLRAMGPGDSFFVARATRRDLTGIVKYAANLGITLEAHEVDEDEIFVMAGVRVWCVTGMPPREFNKATPSPANTPTENSKSEAPAAKVNSEDRTEVTSRYWRKADGTCVDRRKKQLAQEYGDEPISPSEYKTWLEEQEL